MRPTLRSMWHVLWEPSGRAGMLVALVAGAGFEGVGAVAGPFLVDRGYSATTIGLFFAFGTTPAMVLGAFLGGAWADRQDRASVTRNGVVLIAAVVLLVMLADGWEAPGGMLRMLLLGLLYFTIGIYTASSYALFMDLTHPQIGATQFSAYMAGTNLCEGWSAFAVGRLASVFGYLLAFGVLAGASLLSLPLFRTIRAGLGQRLLPDPRD